MAILTKIGNIPLFTSIGEALAWARANFVQGYHTHTHKGRLGYMGGKTHSIALNKRVNTANPNVSSPNPPPRVVPQTPVVPQQTPPTPPVQQQPSTPSQINYGSSSGGSGGGGY